MQVIDIRDAGRDLSPRIHRALAGEAVMLVRADQPLVRIEPLASESRPRIGGKWKGAVWKSADFDEPLEDIERAFYGELPPSKEPR